MLLSWLEKDNVLITALLFVVLYTYTVRTTVLLLPLAASIPKLLITPLFIYVMFLHYNRQITKHSISDKRELLVGLTPVGTNAMSANAIFELLIRSRWWLA